MSADPWAVVSTTPAPVQAQSAPNPWAVVSTTPATPQAAPQESFPGQGIMETADQLGTGLLAQPIAGLAGLGDIPLHALGITKTSPADVVRNVQSSMTYQPYTAQGQSLSSKVGYLPNKLANASDFVGGQVNSSLAPIIGTPAAAGLGTALSTGLQALPMLLGGKPGSIGEMDVPGAISQTTNPAAFANSLGYKLAPSEAGSNILTRSLEGLSNAAKLKGQFSVFNQGVTNDLVAQDLGLPAGTKITSDLLTKLKQAPNSIYQKVSSLGRIPVDNQFRTDLSSLGSASEGDFPLAKNPDIESLRDAYNVPSFNAQSALEQMDNLRQNGYSNIKVGQARTAQNAPMTGALGKAQVATAQALQNQLDRALPGLGADPDLINQFIGARQQLAKIHSVEKSLIGDTGNVSAQALVKQANKKVPLSGNMAQIAQVGHDFPHVTQDLEKVTNNQPLSRFGGLFSIPEIIGGVATGHPTAGLLAGGINLAYPPVVRSIFGSPLVQNSLRDVVNGTVNPATSLTPGARGLIGGTAATSALQALLQGQPNY